MTPRRGLDSWSKKCLLQNICCFFRGTPEAEYCVMEWPDADEKTGVSLSDYM